MEAVGKIRPVMVFHREPQPHLNTLKSFHHRLMWVRPPILGPEPLHLEPGSTIRFVPHRQRPRQPWDCGQPGGLAWMLARRHCGSWFLDHVTSHVTFYWQIVQSSNDNVELRDMFKVKLKLSIKINERGFYWSSWTCKRKMKPEHQTCSVHNTVMEGISCL